MPWWHLVRLLASNLVNRQLRTNPDDPVQSLAGPDHNQSDMSLQFRSRRITSIRDWGLEQALQAPAWSDQLYNQALACLGIRDEDPHTED
jgi:hypothetical protein